MLVIAMRFFIYFFLFLCGFHGPAVPGEIKVDHLKLKNGMEVYVVKNTRIPAVMHMVWYKVGGADDPVDYSGMAHYLEHLMFSGTKKFKDITTKITGVGGEFNAMTSSDFTVYYELVGKGHLPMVMDIESDRMRNIKINSKYAAREQNVVLEERKMRYDSIASNVFFEELSSLFYHNGYGRPVVGWENEILSLDAKNAKKFYNQYYYPNNAVLVIVGDVEFDEVTKLAEKYYGPIKAGNVPERLKRREPVHRSKILTKLEDDRVKEPELYRYYKAPGRMTGNNYLPIDLVTGILGSGKTSILYNSLVLKDNLAVDVAASYEGLVRGDATVLITAKPSKGVSLDKLEGELDRVMDDFIQNGVSADQVKNAKYSYKANVIYSLDDLSSIAQFYGIHLALGIPIEEIDPSFKNLENISVEDINEAIRQVFSTKSTLTGYLLPNEKESSSVTQ